MAVPHQGLYNFTVFLCCIFMLFLCQKSHGIQVRGFSHTEVKLLWFCDFALSKTMSKFLIAKLFSAVFLGIDQIILI